MWWVAANFLVSDPLFLRSGMGSHRVGHDWSALAAAAAAWSDNNAPVTLYQMKVTLCSEKKWKGPRHNLPPQRFRSVLRGGRSQLVAPSEPGPQTCPAVITEGVRSPAQLALRLLKPPKQWRGRRLGPADCYPGDCAAIRSQRQGWGRGSLLPQGRGPASE